MHCFFLPGTLAKRLATDLATDLARGLSAKLATDFAQAKLVSQLALQDLARA
jgi:hypothetical protein